MSQDAACSVIVGCSLSMELSKLSASCCRRLAWKWWKEENHKADYEGTKLWKHVESLDGSAQAFAIPSDAMASGLVGALCGVHLTVREFEYKDFSDSVDVVCHTELDPRQLDPEGPLFDPQCKEKKDWAAEVVHQLLLESANDRALAERFAPSAANFGLLYSRVQETYGPTVKAADPDKVAKMFRHCRKPGVASGMDVFTAQAWQKNDMTYQATGNDGRIIWTQHPDPMSPAPPALPEEVSGDAPLDGETQQTFKTSAAEASWFSCSCGRKA